LAALRLAGAFFAALRAVLFFAGGTVTTFLGACSHSGKFRNFGVTRRARECDRAPYSVIDLLPGP
jgi:hypothetical protein